VRWSLSGNVIATDPTSKCARDASRVPALVKQIEMPLGSVCADGAYDREAVYTAVENHDNRSPRVLIPPKTNARVRPAEGYPWLERADVLACVQGAGSKRREEWGERYGWGGEFDRGAPRRATPAPPRAPTRPTQPPTRCLYTLHPDHESLRNVRVPAQQNRNA